MSEQRKTFKPNRPYKNNVMTHISIGGGDIAIDAESCGESEKHLNYKNMNKPNHDNNGTNVQI